MTFSNGLRMLLIGLVILQSGCSISESSFWPSLTAEDPASNNSSVEKRTVSKSKVKEAKSLPNQIIVPKTDITSEQSQTNQPPIGTGNFEPGGVTAGEATGTFVGKLVHATLHVSCGCSAKHTETSQHAT